MSGPPTLVLATANPDKAREICEILAAALERPLVTTGLEVGDSTVAYLVSPPGPGPAAPSLDHAPDVAETGATLEENARIKAAALTRATGLPAVADDTGLAVDALGGAPGVRSARYAGDHATYADNVARLLRDLHGVPPARRSARFETVALARWPDGRELVARGVVEGRIAEGPRGDGGFGYDPVFVPSEGDGRSFAEMDPGEKHAVSHRGRAFRRLASMLRDAGVLGHAVEQREG